MIDRWLKRFRRHRQLVLILLSGLLVPVVTNLFSSWLETTIGRTPSQLVQLLALGVALVVVLWVLYLALGRSDPVELVPEEERPRRYPGLVVLVGTGREDREPEALSHLPALDYHLDCEEAGGEPLRVCWLIASAGKGGSLPVARRVRGRYQDRCDVVIHMVRDPFDVEETYRVVYRIYMEEAGKHGLAPEEVIADFTGGTKPMSAGVVLACRTRWPMQYMTGGQDKIASVPFQVRFSTPRGG